MTRNQNDYYKKTIYHFFKIHMELYKRKSYVVFVISTVFISYLDVRRSCSIPFSVHAYQVEAYNSYQLDQLLYSILPS